MTEASASSSLLVAAGPSLASRRLRALMAEPKVTIGGGFIVALIVIALFAPWIAPKNPLDQDLMLASLPPADSRAQSRAITSARMILAEKRIFVLTFKGDMRASAVKRLGAEIDAVLIAARPETDETVIRIESPGGTVTGYGLAAAEILRLRDRKLKVTASVDQVAASGGYMMACAADRIVAAPFAIVGSIGVVAPVPNLHRLLKKNEIDFEEITAGEFKRTVSVLGESRRRAANISARSSTRPTRRSRPTSRSADRRSTSTASPTATIGWRGKGLRSASSTRS